MNGSSRVPVLIAEENRSTRNVYRFLLEIAGYGAYEAPDAATAIEVLRTHPTGVVALLDWEMSEAGCMRILRSLAHAPDAAARHRYVLLATAPDRLHSRILTLPASLSIRLLGKPAGMETLLAAVGEAALTVPAPPSSVAR
ncbi:MAG: hypothetical protein ACRDHP_01700 [Ktedonobacterales bacterium]